MTGGAPFSLLGAVSSRPAQTEIAIVVPVHDDTRACLASVQRCTPEPHQIVVIDNDSKANLEDQLGTDRVIRLDSNLGFGQACNARPAATDGEVVVLNNDTVVAPGWIDRPASHASGVTGLVGPTSNHVAEHQGVPNTTYRNDLRGLYVFADELVQRHAGEGRATQWLSGLCPYIRCDLVDVIGGFDPAFGSGLFEDLDYSLRARAAGRDCVIARDVFIHHRGSRTFGRLGVDWHTQMDANFSYFKAKWDLPKDLSREDAFDFGPIVSSGPNPELDYVPLPRPTGLVK